MKDSQKKVLIIGVVAVAAYLIYRYMQANAGGSSGSSATNAAAPTAAADYATLAGQEQSDVAALQQQNSALSAQEQGDVSSLTTLLGGLQSGVSALTGTISGLQSSEAELGTQVAAVATGQQKVVQSIPGAVQKAVNNATTITTHAGGPFYKYYQSVTGKAPPITLATSNLIYEMWKSGVSVVAAKTATGHIANPGHAPKVTASTKQIRTSH